MEISEQSRSHRSPSQDLWESDWDSDGDPAILTPRTLDSDSASTRSFQDSDLISFFNTRSLSTTRLSPQPPPLPPPLPSRLPGPPLLPPSLPNFSCLLLPYSPPPPALTPPLPSAIHPTGPRTLFLEDNEVTVELKPREDGRFMILVRKALTSKAGPRHKHEPASTTSAILGLKKTRKSADEKTKVSWGWASIEKGKWVPISQLRSFPCHRGPGKDCGRSSTSTRYEKPNGDGGWVRERYGSRKRTPKSTEPSPSTTRTGRNDGVPAMNIAVLALGGSHREIEGLVRVGKVLRFHGHRVRILSSPAYKDMAELTGAGFCAVGTKMGRVPKVGCSDVQRVENREYFKEILWGSWDSLGGGGGNDIFVPDLIVSAPMTLVGNILAEALGVRLVRVSMTPSTTPTRHFPHPLADICLDGDVDEGMANKLSYSLVETAVWSEHQDVISEFREHVGLNSMGMGTATTSRNHSRNIPTAFMCSPALFPRDYEGAHLLMGLPSPSSSPSTHYPRRPSPERPHRPSPGLQSFLHRNLDALYLAVNAPARANPSTAHRTASAKLESFIAKSTNRALVIDISRATDENMVLAVARAFTDRKVEASAAPRTAAPHGEVFLIVNPSESPPVSWIASKVSAAVMCVGDGDRNDANADGMLGFEIASMGKPGIYLPLSPTEKWWAERLAAAGAGVMPDDKITVGGAWLSTADALDPGCLERLVDEAMAPAARERARLLGEKISGRKGKARDGVTWHDAEGEDGVGTVVNWILDGLKGQNQGVAASAPGKGQGEGVWDVVDRCSFLPERKATMRAEIAGQDVHLSDIAAAVLVDDGMVEIEDLKLEKAWKEMQANEESEDDQGHGLKLTQVVGETWGPSFFRTRTPDGTSSSDGPTLLARAQVERLIVDSRVAQGKQLSRHALCNDSRDDGDGQATRDILKLARRMRVDGMLAGRKRRSEAVTAESTDHVLGCSCMLSKGLRQPVSTGSRAYYMVDDDNNW
ncbi:hypothetical protein MKZ38_007135 [Zalerion maritima]|uniref:Uncharacterized protein n=1 Tax=Zalerion maritima TaxID=339359 RepID=A0AAD5WUA0_9PEZI|nr:hypothetical protein MKZ38_007135 [Zalerion maritima]